MLRIDPDSRRGSDVESIAHGLVDRIAGLLEPSELALGAAWAKQRHFGRVVVARILREVRTPMTAGGTLAPALDAAKDHSLDLTPSVSAAAAKSAIRASSPFIACAAATPIIDVRVM